MAKLTSTQKEVLGHCLDWSAAFEVAERRLDDGARTDWKRTQDVLMSLHKRGLVEYHKGNATFRITDAGRAALSPSPQQNLEPDYSSHRGTFTVPPGHEAVRYENGRPTGEVRPIVPAPAQHLMGDQHPDDLAVDRFAAAMKAKLAEKRDEGRSGWEDKDDCSQLFLSQLLREHVEKGDPVDVGNLAMMLHQREERISSLLETLQGE